MYFGPTSTPSNLDPGTTDVPNIPLHAPSPLPVPPYPCGGLLLPTHISTPATSTEGTGVFPQKLATPPARVRPVRLAPGCVKLDTNPTGTRGAVAIIWLIAARWSFVNASTNRDVCGPRSLQKKKRRCLFPTKQGEFVNRGRTPHACRYSSPGLSKILKKLFFHVPLLKNDMPQHPHNSYSLKNCYSFMI